MPYSGHGCSVALQFGFVATQFFGQVSESPQSFTAFGVPCGLVGQYIGGQYSPVGVHPPGGDLAGVKQSDQVLAGHVQQISSLLSSKFLGHTDHTGTVPPAQQEKETLEQHASFSRQAAGVLTLDYQVSQPGTGDALLHDDTLFSLEMYEAVWLAASH